MAYQVKWFSEFADEKGNEYITEILDRDYTGQPIKVLSGGTPFTSEMINVDDPFAPIRPWKFTIQWMSQVNTAFEISDVFITDDRKYKLRLSLYTSPTEKQVIYNGFLAPINCEEPFNTKPYPVTLAATCGLPFMHDDYFLTRFGQFIEGKISLIKIISNCLASTGHELPIHAYVNLYEQGMDANGESPLKLAEIDADGLRGKYCYEVLEGVINSLDAFVIQERGAWVIKSVKEQTAFMGRVHLFTSNGESAGIEVVNQSASFGRNPFNDETPNVKPINTSVTESIAEQNSIADNVVSPGIAVNRLPNGTFSGPVLGGNLPGWIVDMRALRHGSGAGWTRAGIGSPDNPYKFEITGADTHSSKGVPSNIRIPSPIILNTGTFDVNKETKVKLIFSGAYRAADISWFSLLVRINAGERDFVSYLDENGKWNLSKKDVYVARIDVDVPANPPNSLNFDEATLQTFEITSDVVNNYLGQGGNAIAKISFEVRAGYVSTDIRKFNTLNPKLSWEDFSVCVTTETIFEGEHKYRVDAKFPIRNPNKAEYITIIADKIGIETPEQNRPENRVMTGYMTRLNGSLTEGWRRYINGALDPTDSEYEPIQKKSLRERVRLLCGKRRIIEGPFKGFGLRADHSVFNRYDSLGTPNNFFTITSYKWDVKKMQFDVSFHELKFDPLANEVIDIANDEEGRRGNRLYAGAGGSKQNGGNGIVKPVEEIVIDETPNVYFTTGIQEIKVVDIEPLIESNHAPIDLVATAIHYTDWISHVHIERGPDGDGLEIHITGWPKVPGTDRVLVELVGPDGEDYVVLINVFAYAPARLESTLIDTSSGGAEIIGAIPGVYELVDRCDVVSNIIGRHDSYQLEIKGGGPTGTAINKKIFQEVNEIDSGTYRLFDEDNGFVPVAGQYTYTITIYLRESIINIEEISFTLYDDEFLSKLEFYLTKLGSQVGQMNPAGITSFVNPGACNVLSIIDDQEHDKVITQLSRAAEMLRSYTHEVETASEMDGDYSVYDEDEPLEPGEYRATTMVYLDEALVLKKYVDFTINKPAVEPVGDFLKLVSMIPNTTDYNVLGTLSLTGGSFTPLPASGWNILYQGVSKPFNNRRFQLFEYRGEGLVEIDVALYLGVPQSQSFPFAVTKADFLIFGGSSSLKVDAIHHSPATFRIIVTNDLDGVTTDKFSADFSFGPAVDIKDVPISDPASDIAVHRAGPGMFEVTEDFGKTFGIRVDDETIEIFESESPDDPDEPGLNHLRIKAKGVEFQHLQDIPDMTVIGNLNGGGGPYAVTVASIMEEAEIGDLITAIAIQNYVTEQLESGIDGTVNYLPKFITPHELGDSVVREVSGKIGVGITPTQVLHVDGNILGTGQLMSTIATGTAPFSVVSSTRVNTLNVDQLDDQHGSYYLDWNNFTNYKSISAGIGLTGGGLLDDNRTISMGAPSTLNASSTNSATGTTHTHAITTDDFVAGSNVVFSGSGANRLIGSGPLTINVNQVPWGIVISRPTTLSGYGITDSLTTGNITTLLTGKEDVFAKGDLIAGSGINLSGVLTDRLVGSGNVTISCTVTGIGGSGTSGYIPKFTAGTTLGNSSIQDNGSYVTFNNEVSMNADVQIFAEMYASRGVIGGAGASASAVLTINSTTQGVLFPRMTEAQRLAISSPSPGLLVYQSDAGSNGAGYKYYLVNQWVNIPFTLPA